MRVNQYPKARRKGASQKSDNADRFGIGNAQPPAHLDKLARNRFIALAKSLHGAGVLRDVDEFGLGELCQAQADVERFTKRLRREGAFTKGPNGGKVYNPTQGLLKDAQKRVKEWSDRLGMNPKARAHLKFPAGAHSPNHPTQDDIDKFLSGESWNRSDDAGKTVPFSGTNGP